MNKKRTLAIQSLAILFYLSLTMVEVGFALDSKADEAGDDTVLSAEALDQQAAIEQGVASVPMEKKEIKNPAPLKKVSGNIKSIMVPLVKKTQKNSDSEKDNSQVMHPLQVAKAPEPVPGDGVYHFVDYFPEVEAKIYDRKTRDLVSTGYFSNEVILFKSFEKSGDIRLVPMNNAGAIKKAISFNLIGGAIHELTFRDFPPGSKLALQYGLFQKVPSKTPQFVYLEVLIGGKVLKRIQVSPKDSWVKDDIDLGVVSFLNRGLVIKFQVTADRTQGLRFTLVPEIHS